MKEISHRPWDSQYEIKDTTIIAETPDLRALHITLAEGDVIPWHFHNHVTENFTCARGVLVVETRAPRGVHRLAPAERLTLPPKTAHRVLNGGDGDCCFVLVQGVGAYDYVPVEGISKGPYHWKEDFQAQPSRGLDCHGGVGSPHH